MGEPVTSSETNDAADLSTVATLLERAGLKLPADQIAALVPGYRSDRAGFERLRTMLSSEDETAHLFRAAPPVALSRGPDA
jgi:hypothetical protein